MTIKTLKKENEELRRKIWLLKREIAWLEQELALAHNDEEEQEEQEEK